MKISVIVNMDKPGAKAAEGKVCESLRGLDIPFSVFHSCPKELENEIYGAADVILTVGGDGTIIHAAKRAARHGKPVLGVNTGRLGFMMSLEPDHLERLALLKTGEYEITHRMMLKCTINGERYYCLNDAMINKDALSRILDIDVKTGGGRLLKYRADGLIFSTPTGSTAYSISAGGPVLDPSLDSILITPICPHSLFSRSIALGPSNVLTAETTFSSGSSAYLIVDGEQSVPLSSGDMVTVERSQHDALLINIDGSSFFDVFCRKFTVWN